MPGKEANAPLKPQDIRGLKYLDKLLPLFQRLHEVGCGRDTAGNRQLHFDEYAALVTFRLFNPLITSMRSLQRALEMPKVAGRLGIKRFSLGSFSEAPAVFQPERLKEIIAELTAEARPLLGNPAHGDERLSALSHALTMVDGTMINALPSLAQAAADGTCYATSADGTRRYAWRLHLQLELGVPWPTRIDVTGASKAGEYGEARVLGRTLEAGRCYVDDAAYADYGLFEEIVKAGSSYVSRMRENATVKDPSEERPLSPEASAAGIVRDVIVWPRGIDAAPVRLLFLKVTPRRRRTRKIPGARYGCHYSDKLVIATSLLGLPAELVALIYQMRYTVELFFRFLKGMLGMRHLVSQRKEGVQIQAYCAIIACLMTFLWTNRRPNKAMMETLNWYMLGLATVEDVIRFLNKPDNTGVKLRAREELRKKLGY